MIAVCILIFSFVVLAQWLIAYCRSFIVASEKFEISKKTREVVGASHGLLDPYEFDLILDLARKAPNPVNDGAQIRAVSAYFRILRATSGIMERISPTRKKWMDEELARCVHFAAVTLDRRLAALSA
jgi:hypothetical protein